MTQADARGSDDAVLAALLRSTDPLLLCDPVLDEAGHAIDLLVVLRNDAFDEWSAGRLDGICSVRELTRASLPEDAPTLVDQYLEVARTGTSFVLDDVPRVDPRSAEMRWYDLRAYRAARSVCLTWRDVTDRHLASEALAVNASRYQLLAENASDVVFEKDAEGRVVWISPSVADMLGHSPESVVGRRSADLLHPDDMHHATAASRTVNAGAVAHYEARFMAADGSSRWLAVVVRPVFGPDGEVVGRVGTWRDVQSERLAREALLFQAMHDPLTGLHNRAWVMDVLEGDLADARRRGDQVAALFVDLDRFKVVNDSLGHAAGDVVLSMIAHRIAAHVRAGDRVGRLGGDEFVIVAPHVRGVEEVRSLAARLADALRQELTVLGHRLVPTASFGLALSSPSSTVESLLREADSALFRAKSSGRDRWELFDESMHDEAVRRLTVESELREALRERQFRVYYQPIVSLRDRAVVGHEALVRWHHPTLGVRAPGEFLPVAEESGLIVTLGRQVAEQVCRDLAEQGERLGSVSVNISAVELSSGDWAEGFLDLVRVAGAPAERLVVEVTETAVLSLPSSATRELTLTREAGVGVHLDDFGTGFSSISVLRDLPITGIKLDRVFVNDLSVDDGSAQALARGLAGLVRALDLTGVAEGVEDEQQRSMLSDCGWELAQGYLFGRPLPLDAARR